MSKIQERIKERRLLLGLTLLQIANKLGVKEATVQRYESGEIKNIKHDTVLELSQILECSPSYLMGWENEKPVVNQENPLNEEEQQLIDNYRQLNEEGQEKVFDYVNDLVSLGKYKKCYECEMAQEA